jgi:hypothetical protein
MVDRIIANMSGLELLARNTRLHNTNHNHYRHIIAPI